MRQTEAHQPLTAWDRMPDTLTSGADAATSKETAVRTKPHAEAEPDTQGVDKVEGELS